jgi:hypothetical protein
MRPELKPRYYSVKQNSPASQRSRRCSPVSLRELVKRRKGTKVKSPKSRCSKEDAIFGKGMPGGSFDIDRVMIYNNCEPFIFIEPLDLRLYVQLTHRKKILSYTIYDIVRY